MEWIYLNKETKSSSSGVCEPVAVPIGKYFGRRRSTMSTVRVQRSDKLNARCGRLSSNTIILPCLWYWIYRILKNDANTQTCKIYELLYQNDIWKAEHVNLLPHPPKARKIHHWAHQDKNGHARHGLLSLPIQCDWTTNQNEWNIISLAQRSNSNRGKRKEWKDLPVYQDPTYWIAPFGHLGVPVASLLFVGNEHKWTSPKSFCWHHRQEMCATWETLSSLWYSSLLPAL